MEDLQHSMPVRDRNIRISVGEATLKALLGKLLFTSNWKKLNYSKATLGRNVHCSKNEGNT